MDLDTHNCRIRIRIRKLMGSGSEAKTGRYPDPQNGMELNPDPKNGMDLDPDQQNERQTGKNLDPDTQMAFDPDPELQNCRIRIRFRKMVGNRMHKK